MTSETRIRKFKKICVPVVGIVKSTKTLKIFKTSIKSPLSLLVSNVVSLNSVYTNHQSCRPSLCLVKSLSILSQIRIPHLHTVFEFRPNQ